MQQHNPLTDVLSYNRNAIIAILIAARRLAPELRTGRKRRGRPPKYETWKLAALCAIKALLNITFKRTAELAPLIVGASPSPATIHRAWVKLKDWAMEAAAKAAGKPTSWSQTPPESHTAERGATSRSTSSTTYDPTS